MSETQTEATETEQSWHPCECSAWTFDADAGPDGGEEVPTTTGCDRDVSGDRNFAQGHDAKLKSFLIAAGVAGAEVGRLADGVTTWMDAQQAADRFGFGHQVRAGIAAGKDAASKRQLKANEKAAKLHAKALRKTEKAIAKRKLQVIKEQVQIKVGRWKYNVVEETAGTFVYIDNKGAEQTIAKSKAKVVA